MAMPFRSSFAASIALLTTVCLPMAAAKAAIFDISWTGSGGYSLTGQLTFADSLLGTGVINGTQIQNLTIDVFLNGVSQGTASLASFDAAIFNLNFNTTTDQFVVGGSATGSAGQLWNFSSTTSVGFGSGNFQQGVSIGSSTLLGPIPVGNSTLSATLVPLPATLPLFATGLAAIGLLGWRRKRKARAGA